MSRLVLVLIIGVFDGVEAPHVPDGWRVLSISEASAEGCLSQVCSGRIPVLYGANEIQCAHTPKNVVNVARVQDTITNLARKRDPASYHGWAPKASYSHPAFRSFVIGRALWQSLPFGDQKRASFENRVGEVH
jgi:hypothetical protein